MKGRNLKCMILAMYYCASKNEGVSLSFKEIANRFNFEEKKIKKAFNYIKSAIVYNLSPDKLNQSILSLIQNFLETKNETFEYKDLADKIALKINESCLLEGRNPNTIAALSLLTASQIIKPNGINRSIICQNFCSENTLDYAFEKIKDSLDKIIPENFYSENKNLSIK